MEEFLSYLNSALPSSAIEVVLRIIFALAVLVIGFKLTNFLAKRLEKVKKTKSLDESALSFLKSLMSVSFKVIIAVTAASILGVPLTAIVTLLGSAGLAIGLALQGSLSNFAGGLMVLIFRPFAVGDYISNHTDEGTVTAISIFYTTLQTPDNRRVVIPNGSISNQSLVNCSSHPTRRVDLEFGVAYDSDIDSVISTIKSTASSVETVLGDPAVAVMLLRQDASALVFGLQAWCLTPNYLATKFALNERMTRAFAEAGIEIPYQKIDIQDRTARRDTNDTSDASR